MSTIANQPAFPVCLGLDNDGIIRYEPGMTYRQWLVGQALQGLCAYHGVEGRGADEDQVARAAIKRADAALEWLDWLERTKEAERANMTSTQPPGGGE